MADRYSQQRDNLSEDERRAAGARAAERFMPQGMSGSKPESVQEVDRMYEESAGPHRQMVEEERQRQLQEPPVPRPRQRPSDPANFMYPSQPEQAPAIPHNQDWENQKAELAQQRAAMAQQQAEVQAAKVQAAKEAAMKALAQPKKSKARQKSLDQLAKELEAEMAGQMSGWQSSPTAVTPTQTDIPWLRGR